MKKFLIIASLFLFTGMMIGTNSGPKTHPVLLDSIKPFTYTHEGGPINVPVCTASNINTKKHYWITANHCFQERPANNFGIDGHPFAVWKVDEKLDLVVVVSDLTAPDLKIAFRTPSIGETVYMASYMNAAKFTFYAKGIVSTNIVSMPGVTAAPQVMFNILSAGGTSGAPVVDESGHLISIVQTNYFQGVGNISNVTGGLPYDDLMKFLQSVT